MSSCRKVCSPTSIGFSEKGKRSAFLTEIVEREVRKAKLLRALEAAQDMANRTDPRTIKLYDRRKDLVMLSEIERRIAFERSRG